MKDESHVQQEVQIKAMHLNCILLRNNSGAAVDNTGRLVRYGFGNISKKHSENSKSSDLLGITKVTITQEMVGKTVGIFTAVEVKKEGWKSTKKLDKREQAQENFMEWVRINGGFAGFASDANDLTDILK